MNTVAGKVQKLLSHIVGEKSLPIDKCAGGELPRGPECFPPGHLR
jgi:hypothetical protein